MMMVHDSKEENKEEGGGGCDAKIDTIFSLSYRNPSKFIQQCSARPDPPDCDIDCNE